jgi:hypothetical protein
VIRKPPRRRCASGEPSRIPKTGTPKNKLRNHGAFFEAEKLTAKTPRFTTQPPRLHHQKTTIKHPFFAKTPAKHHKPTQKKLSYFPHEFDLPTLPARDEFRTVRPDDEKRRTLKGNQAQESMRLSPRELLEEELESVARDIQAIEDQIENDPPDTSGELLRLREIQRTYRGLAASIK